LVTTASQLLTDLKLRKAIAWLWDFDRRRIVWATDAAAVFWMEPAVPDLLGRVFGPRDVLVSELARLRSAIEPNSVGTFRIVLNPEGRTVEASCRVQLHPITDERMGAVIEIEALEESSRTLGALADAALAQSAPTALALYHVDGRLVSQNAAASSLFGEAADLMTRLGDKEIAGTFILRTLADGLYSRTLRLPTSHGVRLHRVTAQAARDPKTGAPALAVSFEDVQDTHDLWRDVTQAFQGLTRLSADLLRGEERGEDTRTGRREGRRRVEDLVEAFPLPLALLGEGGRIDYVNGAAFRLLVRLMDRVEPMGLARRLTKARLEDLVDGDGKAEVRNALNRIVAAKAPDLALRHREMAIDRAWSGAARMMLSVGVLDLDGNAIPMAAFADAPDRPPVAGDEAERKLRRQADFIARLSHELRTPLNAIIGFSQIMTEERFGPVDNPKYKAYVDHILKGSQYLLDLINDILDLSKSEAGKLKLEPTEVDLADAVRSSLSLIEPAAEAAGITIRSLMAAPLPRIVADERSIRQIVLNLLSNAVKFSPRGGTIVVSAEVKADGAVCLEIRDRGVGMTAEEVELALEPYGQVRSVRGQARTATERGTGLGLPLAKALTEANKAEFAIDSAPGRGTRVTLTFPTALVLAE